MRVVCRGWGTPRHPLLVFRDDGQGEDESDTICIPCRDYMLAQIRNAEEEETRHGS